MKPDYIIGSIHFVTAPDGALVCVDKSPQSLAEGVRGMDYSRSITQGGEPQTLLDAVARLVDLDAKIAEEIMKYTAAVDEITAAIKCVEDERLQTLLYLRYVELKKWHEIAAEMDKTERWIYKLSEKSLKKFSIVHCSSC